MSQGLRKGTGDNMVYDNLKDEITLTSNPGSSVTTYDPARGSSDSTWAQWIGSNGEIHLKDDRGGRTKLVIPPK